MMHESATNAKPEHQHTDRHDHDHNHDHGHDHDHDHNHDHGHDHDHAVRGWRKWFGVFFHAHSHEGPQVDRALTGSEQGIRAVKISLAGLLVTAFLQVIVVYFSGSVALLADTIHNFSDGLTALPLWVAFVIGRRPPNRRYTYGWGRAEDIAGIFIVLMIGFSAVLAAYESVRRLFEPQPLRNVGWVIAAAIIGFIGNEVVAQYRIRVGKRIGSAALIADGQHSRVDGFTSLAVLGGAIGALLGWELADPIIGILITVAILFVLRDAGRRIWERLMDAVDPGLVDAIEQTARPVEGVLDLHAAKVRWIGHQLYAELHIVVEASLNTADSHAIAEEVRHRLLHQLPALSEASIHVDPQDSAERDHHALTAHHFV
ncbi:MAG: cation diffusion facilitator family transporter [Chloroflexales bacterium]|nr:cation diffusion facilitator family transporter [Chloroflexales bacterium]